MGHTPTIKIYLQEYVGHAPECVGRTGTLLAAERARNTVEWCVWQWSYLKLADLILKKTNPRTSRMGWIRAGQRKCQRCYWIEISPITMDKAFKKADKTFKKANETTEKARRVREWGRGK
jgi:hypothetical protein